MSNLIKLTNENEYFINSEKIKIFPCAYRGVKEVILNSNKEAKRNIAFQPTARSFSEENLTNNYSRLGTTASYLISNSSSDSEYKIELLLGGYYIVAWLTNDDIETIAANNLHFCLSTQEIELYNTATRIGADSNSMRATTTVIENLADTTAAVGEQLDRVVDGGNTYYFAGVKLAAPDQSKYMYSLQILDPTTGKFLYESRPVFENLKTGHGFNSLINAGNKSDDVVACIANGDYSTALGKSTVVNGNCGFAIGEFTISNGNAAVACGTNAVANGDYSFSCGDTTNAIMPRSVAFGKNTQAYSENQLVIGQFNEIPEGESKPETAFTIGIGNDNDNRKNLLNILKNGDVILDSNNNAIVIGNTSNKASLLISDTFNLDDQGNLTLMKNKKVRFGNGLEVDNTKIHPETAINAAEMTLNGSFYETGTFSLGTSKSEPEVKISSSEAIIKYNNVNIGNNTSNVAISTNNITVHNKDIIIDTNNAININDITTFDVETSKLNNTLFVKKDNARTFVTVGDISTPYPDKSLVTQGGLFTNGDLQATVSEEKNFAVNIVGDENKLIFGKSFVVDANSSKSTFNTAFNILNGTVDITNDNVKCFGVTVDSNNITAPEVTKIAVEKAVINCNNISAGDSISARSLKLQDDSQEVSITPVSIVGQITDIDLSAIAIDSTNINVKEKNIINCNKIESASPDITINDNTLSKNTFSFGTIIGGNSTSFTVNRDTTINGVTTINGDLTAYGTVKADEFDTNSDIRLKENIVDFTNENSILDLPIKKFNYIADKSKTVHIGCIAQDLQQIYPELVHTDANGYLSIEESKLVYLLIDEVKKLKEEVKKLKEN